MCLQFSLTLDPALHQVNHHGRNIEPWKPRGWSNWGFYHSRIRDKPGDTIENIVDVAHFPRSMVDRCSRGRKNKVFREDPILGDGDDPINKLRRWYELFYLPRETTRQ